jgi:hypothetical protein
VEFPTGRLYIYNSYINTAPPVIIDKFTKWVEVEPVRTISARSAVKFIRGLVCHFGGPNRIITDNGSQFTSGLFREYCTSVSIKNSFASIAHPWINGQADRANAEVLKGLKTRSFNSSSRPAGRNGYSPSMSCIKRTSSTIVSSNLKKPGVRQHFVLQDTNRACVATIAAMFEQGLWRSEI